MLIASFCKLFGSLAARRPLVFGVGLGVMMSGAAMAGSMGSFTDAGSYDGWYLGGNIGVATLLDKESTSPVSPASHDLSAFGLIGGGMVGYDYSLTDSFKLGAEWFMNATGLNVSADQNYGTYPSYTANMRYDIGIRLLPGYAFSPDTVGYVVLGYANGKFNIKDTGNFGFIQQSFSENGFQPGLGVKTVLWNHISLRGDVLYTTYSPQSSVGFTLPPAVQNYNNKFSTLSGNLTLLYKFL